MAAVVMTSGSTILIASVWLSVTGVAAESVTVTVKFAVPAGPAGSPVMTPAALSDSPVGRAPALTLKARVPVPPVTASDRL